METAYGEWLLGVNERYEEDIIAETSVSTAERGGIKKVLTLEAEGSIGGVELLRGEAEASGRVNFRLLYLDRQDRLCGLDYFKDFKCRISGERISPEGRCVAEVQVIEAESRLVGDDVDLSAVLKVVLRYFGEEKSEIVSGVTEAEVKRETVATERVLKSERRVELEKEENSGPEVKKILLFGARVIPGPVLEKAGGRDVTGEVRISVIYLTQADEAVEKTLTLPFAETFEGEGAREYALSIANSRIVLTGDEEGGSMETEVVLVVRELGYEISDQECVTAVCGEKVQVEEVEVTKPARFFKGQSVLTERIAGVIPFEVGDAYVAFVRPGCLAVANLSAEEGAVIAEGVAAFQVVYAVGESYDSLQGELPFSFRFSVPSATANAEPSVGISIGSVRAEKTGAGLAVTAEVTASITLFEEKTCRCLAGVKEGDPIPESEAGVSVYFAEKGEDVWTIAKGMGVLPSALIRANPFLELPLEENKKVLIFRKK